MNRAVGAVLLTMLLATPAWGQGEWQAEGEFHPRITIRTDRGDVVHRSDRVTVSFETDEDGYVTLFRVDTDGRIRILFPTQPWDDNFAVGGRRHRVPHPSGNRGGFTFAVDDYPGVGYLVAVLSRDPYEFDPYVRNDHWEYRAVAHEGRITGDPYVAVDEIVEQLLPPGYTMYGIDVLPYFVEQQYDYPRFLCYDCHTYVAYPVWDPYRDWCGTFRIVIYDDFYRYPSRLYPGRGVVVAARVSLRPRYVIKTRLHTDPYVTRIRPMASGTPPALDGGVTGRQLGGIGSVPAPKARAGGGTSGGFSGVLRRLVGGEDAKRPATRARPDAARSPDAQPRPQLERRAKEKPDTPATTRRPAAESGRPGKSGTSPRVTPARPAPTRRPAPATATGRKPASPSKGKLPQRKPSTSRRP
ncbi:MAG: DUF4384 domain-containing protein [Gemmatimonadota bacterium]|nr:DUF4384 domain-containing protein [Gemmatimonadota bacterium]MDH3369420.1 DUF4384 domain-containing protein [Gemmatimonadota bacterium]MDH3479370.1 DUF4384 domain-containing protein [Gemmatimonadota bacterium]